MFDTSIGLLKRGTIVSYIPETGEVKIQLNDAQAIRGSNSLPITAPLPLSLFYNNGLFIGSRPVEGTPVIVGQGVGNKYYISSFVTENPNALPALKSGELLIKSNEDTKISLNKDNNINIGSNSTKIHIDTGSKNNIKTNLITLNFHNENHFTQASRNVSGLVKRDLKYNDNFDQNSKLENDTYDSKFKLIGMDPSATVNDATVGPIKNPAFVESRELIYEFQNLSKVSNDLNESYHYSASKRNKDTYSFPNRRASRADTLSLTLLEPNYLIETIKGTVIDIFGNILDINRNPLPVGKDKNTIRVEKTEDKQDSFIKIKELERKSLAYHFEINARKNLNQKSNSINSTADLLDINSNTDNSRIRSRFFVDIDKEGQMKVNIPASSETGNISLLTRYENYSSFGTEDNGNPNKLIYREDNLDIFLDSFAAPSSSFSEIGLLQSKERGSIKIKDGDADGAPLDRITENHIKHGTAHHDIMKSCYLHQSKDFINYQKGTTSPLTVDIISIPLLEKVVSDTIETSGDNANAGGRSLSINLDGAMEMSIGANTVDRQSLWLDTAGGIVANIGRDKNMRSAIVNMDGEFYMQVGGFGIVGDSRFVKQNNGAVAGVVDLRVFGAGGFSHLVRIDNNGVSVLTPGNVAVHAGGDMKLTADANMTIEAEGLMIQGRWVKKGTGGSI